MMTPILTRNSLKVKFSEGQSWIDSLFLKAVDPGPSWSGTSHFSLVRVRSEPLGPGPMAFGPWIPGLNDIKIS